MKTSQTATESELIADQHIIRYWFRMWSKCPVCSKPAVKPNDHGTWYSGMGLIPAQVTDLSNQDVIMYFTRHSWLHYAGIPSLLVSSHFRNCMHLSWANLDLGRPDLHFHTQLLLKTNVKIGYNAKVGIHWYPFGLGFSKLLPSIGRHFSVATQLLVLEHKAPLQGLLI